MNISDFYMTAPLYSPPFFENREFGIFKNGQVIRHLAFVNVEKLRAFLIEHHPDHVYFSSAKYEIPDWGDMVKKKTTWIGSDLVFDIDFDHLKKKTISEAKRQSLKLISILRFDFGLQDLMLTFSGNRGYHVHCRDSCIQSLNNAARHEIADYFKETYEPQGKIKPNPNYVGIDAQVTADFTRLIRLPGSLHGGSGKMCEIIPLDSVTVPIAPKMKTQQRGMARSGQIREIHSEGGIRLE